MKRRGFLKGILALGVAPAFVRAESLMAVAPKLWVPSQSLIPFDAAIPGAEDMILFNPKNLASAAALWPGVNRWYKQYYDEMGNKQFSEIFLGRE
jgi:hypothetical protein